MELEYEQVVGSAKTKWLSLESTSTVLLKCVRDRDHMLCLMRGALLS